jgi:F-type H+-transporting ATPase subunit delta
VSDETKIARVYAEALLEAAVETGAVDEAKRDLTEFRDALERSTELHTFFFDEDISGTEKSSLLGRLTEGSEPLVTNFLRLLADKDREFVLFEAVEIFLQLVEKQAGVVKVELTTAVTLPRELSDEIHSVLESSLKKTVDLKLTVDDSIVGGVRLRVGDRVADASIRHRLDQLRTLLAKPMANLEVSVEAAP